MKKGTMQKWEYRIDVLDNDGSDQYLIKRGSPDGIKERWTWGTLNDLGADGWELVEVIFDPTPDLGGLFGYFKRAVAEGGA